MNKRGRFAPFWIMLALLGILFLGALITPFRIVLDDIFERIDTNATNEGDSKLSCTDPDAYWFIKSTCFTLGGFMVMFIVYTLYYWISGMIAGAKKPTAVFAPRHRQAIDALESS